MNICVRGQDDGLTNRTVVLRVREEPEDAMTSQLEHLRIGKFDIRPVIIAGYLRYRNT